MNNAKQGALLAKLMYRQFSQSAVKRSVTEVPSSKFSQLKEIQKKYAVEDGTPVFLKGGFGDKALYGLTLAILAVSVGMSFQTFYILAYRK